VDLSAVIFVVLALAWAVYLIPKALKHHDEMASDRLVESHSERVRILRRKPSGKPAEVMVQAEAAPADRAQSRPLLSARPARSAAQRRRRVLAVLVLALAVVAGLSYFAVVPRWSLAVPAGLILLFLLVARLSVRRAQRSSLARRRPVEAVTPVESEELRAAGRQQASQPVEEPAPVSFGEQVDVPLHEETAVEDSVLADDGSLWDPLPMTLPTYVSKARARRTVRTIELTGMQSSGHDEGDSALAREAETPTETGTSAERRKAAGA
jgi:hypothetical protein